MSVARSRLISPCCCSITPLSWAFSARTSSSALAASARAMASARVGIGAGALAWTASAICTIAAYCVRSASEIWENSETCPRLSAGCLRLIWVSDWEPRMRVAAGTPRGGGLCPPLLKAAPMLP